MKKLLAIFAILAAFSSTAFAQMSGTDEATATVNVWNNISVTVTLTTAPAEHILVGGTTSATFDATGTWDASAPGFAEGWTTTDTDTDEWTVSPSGTNLVATLNATSAGTKTITATYTVSYTF